VVCIIAHARGRKYVNDAATSVERENEETRLARRETTAVEPRQGSAAESASGIAIVNRRETRYALLLRTHALGRINGRNPGNSELLGTCIASEFLLFTHLAIVAARYLAARDAARDAAAGRSCADAFNVDTSCGAGSGHQGVLGALRRVHSPQVATLTDAELRRHGKIRLLHVDGKSTD